MKFIDKTDEWYVWYNILCREMFIKKIKTIS